MACSREKLITRQLNSVKDVFSDFTDELRASIEDYFCAKHQTSSDSDDSIYSSDLSDTNEVAETMSSADILPDDHVTLSEEDQPLFGFLEAPETGVNSNLTDSATSSAKAYCIDDNKLSKTFSCKCEAKCYELFTSDELRSFRLQHSEMDHNELDMHILGKIESDIHDGASTSKTKVKSQTKRQRTRLTFRQKGNIICRDTFMYIHGISKDNLNNLKSHFLSHGCQQRVHGNSFKRNKLAIQFDDSVFVKNFVENYASTNGLLLPGRVPGFKRDDVIVLPCHTTIKQVHSAYADSANLCNVRVLKQTAFRDLWKCLVPNIRIASAMSDLCWTCKQHCNNLVRFANQAEEDKSLVLVACQQHLDVASKERALYISECKSSSRSFHEFNITELNATNLEITTIASVLFYVSWDFAQQVFIPSDPLQPGPIYFKTPRKVGLFGIVSEALPRMDLFIIDEAVNVSKGANLVISLLDYYLNIFQMGNAKLSLSADNCCGQNKNNVIVIPKLMILSKVFTRLDVWIIQVSF